MTWEQEIQLAVERERDCNEKIIAEQAQALTAKDLEIAKLKAQLAAVSGVKSTARQRLAKLLN